MTFDLDRRSLLGGALALGAGGLGAAPAGAAPARLAGRAVTAAAADPAYALTPAFGTNWRALTTFSGSSATQLPAGVRVTTPHLAAQADAGQIALWALKPVQGDFAFLFTYKVLYRVAATGGSFGTFYLDSRGEGSATYPSAMPDWAGITPSDDSYAAHARGLRFSFATYNKQQPDIDQRLRLRYFNLGAAVLVGAPSPKAFPFTTGKAYTVAVRRVGTVLGVTVAQVGARKGTPAATYAWADPRIAEFGEGYVGFRWRAQDCEVTNVSLTPLAAPAR